ncbi:MAG: hypothetical protein R3D00_30375 [Bacteroidia bacterium]
MVDSLLERASEKFEYENFTDAIPLYEQVIETGYVQEQIFYRLAYMYEKKGNFPASIYYLRKIQWEFGGGRIEDKIGQLMGVANRERLSAGETWSSYRLFLHHNYFSLTLFLAVLTMLSSVVVIRRVHGIFHAIGIVSGVIAIVFSIILLEQAWFSPRRAVVMQSTAFYEEPGFGANYRSLPIGPGATVTIKEEQDIWCRISMGQFEAWVPAFIVKEITE